LEIQITLLRVERGKEEESMKTRTKYIEKAFTYRKKALLTAHNTVQTQAYIHLLYCKVFIIVTS
jgi:hypothetical protein